MTKMRWRNLLVCAGLVVMLRATAARAADMDVWLDRASVELQAVIGTPGQINQLPDLTMGMMIVQARGSDADRALLQKLLDTPFPPRGPRTSEADHRLSMSLSSAEAMCVIGDIESAKTLLMAAEQQLGEKGVQFVSGHEMGLAFGWALAGDFERGMTHVKAGLIPRSNVCCILAHFAAGARRNDLRDKFMEQALKQAGEDDRQLRKLAVTYAELDQFAAAVRVAESIPDTYHRMQTLSDLAREAHRAGKPRLAHETLVRAIELVPRLDRYTPLGMYDSLCNTAKATRDAKAFALASDRALEAVEQGDEYQSFWASHAFRAAFFGNKQLFQQMIERAIKVAAEDSDKTDRAEAELYIAAAYACAGDRASAVRWHEQSRKTFLQDDYDVSEGFARFTTGTVLGGNPQQAIDDALAAFKDSREASFVRATAAEESTRLGQFDKAWSFAWQIDQYQFRRIALLRHVARHQVAAGQSDALMKQVQAMDDRRERAAVLLGVAQRMLGIDGMGYTKVFRVEP